MQVAFTEKMNDVMSVCRVKKLSCHGACDMSTNASDSGYKDVSIDCMDDLRELAWK